VARLPLDAHSVAVGHCLCQFLGRPRHAQGDLSRKGRVQVNGPAAVMCQSTFAWLCGCDELAAPKFLHEDLSHGSVELQIIETCDLSPS